MQRIKLSQKALNRAIYLLNSGGVVICPTDTVYGFLALAGNRKAVEKVFKIKKRPKTKPLAFFVFSIKQAKELAQISKDQEKILKKHWPGKFTFILKRKKIKIFGAKKNTIALRIPNNKFLLGLLKKINDPLAQTSVNVSSEPPLIKIKEIIKKFGKANLLIVDAGDLPGSKPSKIIDLTSSKQKVLRN